MRAAGVEENLQIGGSTFVEGLVGAKLAAGARPVVAVDKDAAVEAALPTRCILRVDKTALLRWFTPLI